MQRERAGWRALVTAALVAWGSGCGPEGTTPEAPGQLAETVEPAPTPVVPPPPRDSQEPTTAPQPWSHLRGGPQDDIGTGVAVGGAGDVLWAWVSTPRSDEDREPQEGEWLALQLSRYTATGEHVWTLDFPRNRVSELRVGASEGGAAYLTGNAFLYAVDFGLGAAQDGFLVRFSQAGQPEWQQRVGQKVYGLSVDAAGEVLVSGEEWTEEGHVPLLMRYGPEGEVRWTRWLEGAGEGTQVGAVALGASGRAVLTVTLSGELELDDRRFGVEGARSLAVLVFEPDGSLAWGRALSGVDGHLTGASVREDSSVVVTGVAQGAVDWGGSTQEGGPFLLTLDARGQAGWLRRPGCGASSLAPSLAVEATGAVAVACGSTLSLFAADGTPRGERTLLPTGCTSGACTLTSTAIAPAKGQGWVVTGQQRDGVTTDAWNQEAFLRLVEP